MPGKTVTKHAEKYEGSESKVKFNSKLLKDERFWTIRQTQIDVRFTKIQQTF